MSYTFTIVEVTFETNQTHEGNHAILGYTGKGDYESLHFLQLSVKLDNT